MRGISPAGVPIRVCVFGDSFANGTGDDTGLGWVGRVTALLRGAGRDVTTYGLGIRGDTSTGIAARWRAEAALRLPSTVDGRVVFSFGANDCSGGEDGQPRVALADTLAATRAILSDSPWPVLMIGPPPIADHGSAAAVRLVALDAVLAAACAEAGVPYLPVLAALTDDATWVAEARAGDGAHPNAGGYRRLADLAGPWLAARL